MFKASDFLSFTWLLSFFNMFLLLTISCGELSLRLNSLEQDMYARVRVQKPLKNRQKSLKSGPIIYEKYFIFNMMLVCWIFHEMLQVFLQNVMVGIGKFWNSKKWTVLDCYMIVTRSRSSTFFVSIDQRFYKEDLLGNHVFHVSLFWVTI